MTEINNCMRSLFGDFVPETNDASTKALLWHTVKDILIEEEVNMKWTKEELEKEVAGYRPFAIETAKTQHKKYSNESDTDYEHRIENLVEIMCDLHREKIINAYGVAMQ